MTTVVVTEIAEKTVNVKTNRWSDIMSQRCNECKHYREANAYVFDGEKSYCAKGHDIGYAQLDYSLYDKKCKDYILNISRK